MRYALGTIAVLAFWIGSAQAQITLECATVSSGGGVVSTSPGQFGNKSIFFVGQRVVGRASSASLTLEMGVIPCMAASPCPGDVNGDNITDLTDLAILLSNFDLTGATFSDGDLSGDGTVDLTDLALLLSAFDAACP